EFTTYFSLYLGFSTTSAKVIPKMRFCGGFLAHLVSSCQGNVAPSAAFGDSFIGRCLKSPRSAFETDEPKRGQNHVGHLHGDHRGEPTLMHGDGRCGLSGPVEQEHDERRECGSGFHRTRANGAETNSEKHKEDRGERHGETAPVLAPHLTVFP